MNLLAQFGLLLLSFGIVAAGVSSIQLVIALGKRSKEKYPHSSQKPSPVEGMRLQLESAPPASGSLATALATQNQDSQTLIDTIRNNEALEERVRDYYYRQFRLDRWRQFVAALLGNGISIIIGWLLSGLIQPNALVELFMRK